MSELKIEVCPACSGEGYQMDLVCCGKSMGDECCGNSEPGPSCCLLCLGDGIIETVRYNEDDLDVPS